jgi:hypothetical protein
MEQSIPRTHNLEELQQLSGTGSSLPYTFLTSIWQN